MNNRSIGRIATFMLLVVASLFVGACAAAGQQSPEVDVDAEGVEQQLEQLRIAIESQTQDNYSDLAPQVAQLRQTLEQAYQEGDMAESWQELEPQLETLEQQLRDESGDALTTLDAVLSQMRSDLQP